jgi:hypothetical protein
MEGRRRLFPCCYSVLRSFLLALSIELDSSYTRSLAEAEYRPGEVSSAMGYEGFNPTYGVVR